MINRRKFLKSSLLWVPAGPAIIKATAQEVIPTRRKGFPGSVASAGASICSQATAWSARVVTNGGAAPSNATLTAICTYYNSLVSAGVDTLMLADALFVPDNLTAAITPFFNTLGNDPWTNHNFVSGDLSNSGLTGNGSSKYLATGVIDNAAWVSGVENGIGVYFTSSVSNGLLDTGSLDINNQNMSRLVANPLLNSVTASCYDTSNVGTSYPFGGFSGSHPGGFVAQVRQSAIRADAYAGNSIVSFASLGNTVTQGAGRPLGFEQFVMAVNNNGTAANFCAQTIQWAGFFRGLGMTLTKVTALFNAVQALQVALGRAQ